MHLYLFFFWLGFSGVFAMALLGLGHGHGHGHQHAGGHDAHGSHGHAPGSPHGADAHHTAPSAKLAKLEGAKSLWLLFSPRVLFTALLGFGGAGLLLERVLDGWMLLVAALVCAWLFQRWVVTPLWDFLFGFASAPARTLDSALLENAEAVTQFDAEGHGLVKVELDGQIVQMLGRLDPQEREYGVRVRAGDQLSISGVDVRRNRCTVTRRRC